MQKIKERLKSKVVWVAVVAQVALIVALFDESMSTEIKTIATAMVEMATLFGILNNPASQDEF